jgi:hypothetical protein
MSRDAAQKEERGTAAKIQNKALRETAMMLWKRSNMASKLRCQTRNTSKMGGEPCHIHTVSFERKGGGLAYRGGSSFGYHCCRRESETHLVREVRNGPLAEAIPVPVDGS